MRGGTERDAGERCGPTRADTERFQALERENREPRRENESLRKASGFVVAAALDRLMT